MPPKNVYFIDGRRLYRRREFIRKNGVLWPFYGMFAAMLFFIVVNFANAARSTSAAGLYMHKKNPARTGSFLLVFNWVFFIYVPKQRGKIGYVKQPFKLNEIQNDFHLYNLPLLIFHKSRSMCIISILESLYLMK